MNSTKTDFDRARERLREEYESDLRAINRTQEIMGWTEEVPADPLAKIAASRQTLEPPPKPAKKVRVVSGETIPAAVREYALRVVDPFKSPEVREWIVGNRPSLVPKLKTLSTCLIEMSQRGELIRTGKGTAATYQAGDVTKFREDITKLGKTASERVAREYAQFVEAKPDIQQAAQKAGDRVAKAYEEFKARHMPEKAPSTEC